MLIPMLAWRKQLFYLNFLINKENIMNQEHIELVILGKSINSIRLDELNKILSSYQNILDRSYLAYHGKGRMTQSERDNFYATCQTWREGSIYIDFLIYAPAFAQLVLEYGVLSNFETHLNPISKLMDATINFFKEKERIYTSTGNNAQVVINNGNVKGDIKNIKTINNHIHVEAPVAKASDTTQPDYHSLASCMRKMGITEIRSYAKSGTKNSDGFSITREDADILFPEKKYDDTLQKMNVKIYQFNANSGKGMLAIIDLNYPDNPSKISFEADKEEVSYDKIIEAMHDSVKQSEISVTRIINYHPSGTETTGRFYIKNIK